MIIVNEEKLPEYKSTLLDQQANMASRTQALFCLRTLASVDAVETLKEAFRSEDLQGERKSDLLMHEICYCLGQMNKGEEQTKRIQEFLEQVLREGLEEKHAKIVVHEAVEAIANLCEDGTFELLKSYITENDEIVKETVFLAEKMLNWLKDTENGKSEGLNLQKLKFTTNDPAPPYNFVRKPEFKDVEKLKTILINREGEHDLFERYRAMFTLREINTEEAAKALGKSMLKENEAWCSPLLKHEVAFVVAQMEEVHHVCVPYLLESVNNAAEAPIVKHEALIALGDMVDDEAVFEPFLSHPELVVSQSAEVAINMVKERKAQKEAE